MRFQLTLRKEHFRLLIVGGGSAGSAVASRFSRILPNPAQQIAVVEPSDTHYYQPGFTLVGGGLIALEKIRRREEDVLPKNVKWIKERVEAIQPKENSLTLGSGSTVSYDFLVLAAGLELRYDLISGLGDGEAFNAPGLCSIYSPRYVEKVLREIRNFNGHGNAVFTHPNTPIKCAGATQKICYLAEEAFRMAGKRLNTRVIYATALGKVFGVDKYAASLMKIVEERGIELKTRHNLRAVDTERKVATFELLDEEAKSTGETRELEYSLLHVGAPCSPVRALRESAARGDGLTDTVGWVDVDPKTMQGRKFENVFALGDCANATNARTAAAASSQFKALAPNLLSAMEGKKLNAEYDGYSSCPLVVDRHHVVLAEFNPSGPLETFPWDQGEPSRIAFLMKRYGMPWLYWHLFVKGRWEGPGTIRRLFDVFRRGK